MNKKYLVLGICQFFFLMVSLCFFNIYQNTRNEIVVLNKANSALYSLDEEEFLEYDEMKKVFLEEQEVLSESKKVLEENVETLNAEIKKLEEEKNEWEKKVSEIEK